MIERLRQPGGTLGTLSLASAGLLAVVGVLGVLALLVSLVTDSGFWSENASDKVVGMVFFALAALGAYGFLIEDTQPAAGAGLAVVGGLALAIVMFWTIVTLLLGLGVVVVAVMRARAMHGGLSVRHT